MITLTVAEIYDLACMSGFTINHRPDFMPDADDMEACMHILVGKEKRPLRQQKAFRLLPVKPL